VARAIQDAWLESVGCEPNSLVDRMLIKKREPQARAVLDLLTAEGRLTMEGPTKLPTNSDIARLLEQARGIAARLEAHVAAALNLHRPHTVCELIEDGEPCPDTADGEAGGHYHTTICRSCCADDDDSGQTEVCADVHTSRTEPCYPCATRRALTDDA
jgi:hypothetical protein